MSKRKLEKHTANALKAVEKDEPVPAAVFLPPAQRDAPNVVYAFTGELPDIKQNLVRIQQECDPVGLLIAIATGQPVATYEVKKGKNGEQEVKVKYETLPLSSPVRERVIRHLADKVVPRLSVKATQRGGKDPNKGDGDGDAEWEASIGNAAERHDEEAD